MSAPVWSPPSAWEGLRRILVDFGLTFQATKTWTASPDPDFEAKKNRVLDLYDNPPAGGRVICFDKFGPLNLQPHPGRGWYPKGHPTRLRATYTRPHGVRQMLYRIHPRKRWQEVLAFFKILRRRFPGQRLYIVLDNFSPHRRKEVRDWCDANDVELVFTPTYASHAQQVTAIRDYIRLRNRRASPKRDLAVNSSIRHLRHSDYRNKAA